MRFFSIAIPLALSVFVAASPVAIDNNKAMVAREASPVAFEHAIEERQVPADPVAVLKGLKDVLDLQTQVITTNAFDANRVAGALRTVNAAFTEAIASLKAGGANPDVNAAGLGGLLQNILGGLLGGLLGGGKGGGLFGKRQADDATTALAEVLDKLNTLLRSIPFTTALSPVTQQLTAALTPLVLQLTAAVNSQNPGTVGGVQGILNAVAAILKGLTSGLKV